MGSLSKHNVQHSSPSTRRYDTQNDKAHAKRGRFTTYYRWYWRMARRESSYSPPPTPPRQSVTSPQIATYTMTDYGSSAFSHNMNPPECPCGGTGCLHTCREAIPMRFIEQVRRVEVLADDVHVQRLHRRDSVITAPFRRGGERVKRQPIRQ